MVTHGDRERPRANAVFRALADPTRRSLLGLLRQGPQSVGELASHFRTSRPAISRHLRALRQAGLVEARRAGTSRICRLTPAPLHAVREWLNDYEAFWGASLAGLKRHLEQLPPEQFADDTP